MNQLEKNRDQDGKPNFATHVKTVAYALREALADLVASAGADPTQPQEMARRFDLNKNLTWKISRIICETDPMSTIPLLPGKSGMGILVRSLKAAGASERAVSCVHRALAEFDRMVNTHTGDRHTLEMMLGNLTRDGEQQRNEAHRKLAFRGNSAIWGVQARVQLTTNIIAPSSVAEDKVDLGWLSGLVDFRRLRPDVPWAIASARKFETNGKELAVGRIEAIDPRFAKEGDVPLLGDFCSQPIPEIRSVDVSEGTLRYELAEGPVGNTAAATCIVGLFGRAFITRYRYGVNTLGEHIARLSTPVELLIHDLFVHEDLDYAMNPEVTLHNQLPGGPMYPTSGRDVGRLPLQEQIIELGPGANGVLTPEVTQYRKMLHSVFERLNWDPARFRGFRFKQRFPPIPSLAILRYELPERV